jgi:hypothetical protein
MKKTSVLADLKIVGGQQEIHRLAADVPCSFSNLKSDF